MQVLVRDREAVGWHVTWSDLVRAGCRAPPWPLRQAPWALEQAHRVLVTHPQALHSPVPQEYVNVLRSDPHVSRARAAEKRAGQPLVKFVLERQDPLCVLRLHLPLRPGIWQFCRRAAVWVGCCSLRPRSSDARRCLRRQDGRKIGCSVFRNLSEHPTLYTQTDRELVCHLGYLVRLERSHVPVRLGQLLPCCGHLSTYARDGFLAHAIHLEPLSCDARGRP